MSYHYNEEEIVQMAHFILENNTTIRETAKEFNIPKSTVHHNLSKKLKYINLKLYEEVKNLLKNNFEIKHIHGGESTRIKYEKLKNEINKNDEIEFVEKYF